MKKIYLASLLVLVSLAAQAQYAVRCPYLVNPDIAIPYVDSCASFWTRAYDSAYGGFYTNIDRSGNVITSWGLNKNLVTTSRDAYGFTRGYMLTGNERYLTMARNALNFMYQHAWDTLYGGWHSTIDRYGNSSNPNENKSMFDQHYALLGIATYYEATRDTLDWTWLVRGYESNESHLWDSSAQRFGYYDYGTYNWLARSGKSFNATVDAITTNVLYLYLMTGDNKYRTRLEQLTRNMLDRLVASMSQQTVGFVESYNTDWSWNNNSANYNTRTIMGHVLKTAWCLGRMHQILPDTSYITAAGYLVNNVLLKGYDHVFGGPYKDYDRVTGQMFMYGQADTAKAWWQMEQAVTAGLMLYDITGDPVYLQMADETLNFFMTYFVDHLYGEVYPERNRYGGQIWGTEKGNSSKAAYHSTELGYYVYLYGNLFVHHKPVKLHYKFIPETTDRAFRMNPLAFNTDKYRIKEVLRDSALYTDYDADSRLLRLQSGIGGHFIVTYEPTAPPTLTVTSNVSSGWNLVSLPVIVSDPRKSAIFPTAVSAAFAYNGIYTARDTLENGTGYWLKFPSSESINLTGYVSSTDTVNVQPGWNMIGSVSSEIPVSHITSVPGGITTSSIFEYKGTYLAADTIKPGRGYWIKAQQAGKLILSSYLHGRSEDIIKVAPTSDLPPPPPPATSKENVPSEFALGQNYPNPFNPQTVIRYQLPIDSKVTLKVYNLIGQVMMTPVDADQGAGYKLVALNAGALASGVYYYRLEATSSSDPGKSFTQVRKMIICK